MKKKKRKPSTIQLIDTAMYLAIITLACIVGAIAFAWAGLPCC